MSKQLLYTTVEHLEEGDVLVSRGNEARTVKSVVRHDNGTYSVFLLHPGKHSSTLDLAGDISVFVDFDSYDATEYEASAFKPEGPREVVSFNSTDFSELETVFRTHSHTYFLTVDGRWTKLANDAKVWA